MSAAEMELSPEERCERVRMALAEAGHIASVLMFPSPLTGEMVPAIATTVPPEIQWRAWFVTGEMPHCWPCWKAWTDGGQVDELDCPHDPLTSPWPEVVR